jgi:hypothetical protein
VVDQIEDDYAKLAMTVPEPVDFLVESWMATQEPSTVVWLTACDCHAAPIFRRNQPDLPCSSARRFQQEKSKATVGIAVGIRQEIAKKSMISGALRKC